MPLSSKLAVLFRRRHYGNKGPEPVEVAVPWDRAEYLLPGMGWTPGRPEPIKGIVWHTTEGSYSSYWPWWNRCACAGAHFTIRTDGTIILHAKLHDRTWHAGTTVAEARHPYWASHNANDGTVGVEIEAFAAQGINHAQIKSAIKLARWLTVQYNIIPEHRPHDMRGHKRHSDISNQRSDPGWSFPMDAVLAACRTVYRG